MGFWNRNRLWKRTWVHLRLIRVREDPAPVVLGFDHEDAEPGDEDVVDLRGPVIECDRDVIHQVMVRGVEALADGAREERFAAVLECSATGVAGCSVAASDEADDQGSEYVEEDRMVPGAIEEERGGSLDLFGVESPSELLDEVFEFQWGVPSPTLAGATRARAGEPRRHPARG